MKVLPRILHFEESAPDAALVRGQLVSEELVVERACTRREFEAALAGGKNFELILCDQGPGGGEALTALAWARRVQPAIPVIVIANGGNEETAMESLHAGASDFLLKTRLQRLAGAIRRALAEADRQRQARETEAALRESEARFRMIFEEGPLGITMVSFEDGHFIGVNEAFCEMLGYTERELLRLSLSDITFSAHQGEDAEAIRALEQGLIRKHEIKKRLVKKNGEVIWVARVLTRISGTGGAPAYVLAMGQDITERVRMEALLEWEKRALELIASPAPLAEILHALVLGMEAHVPGSLCSILLLDEDGLHLREGAAPSLPAAYNRVIDGMAIGPTEGSCGTAAYTRRQVIVADIASDPLWVDFRELALGHGLAACWSTPILNSAGKVLGTFAIYDRAARHPTPAELELMARAQHLAGLAIERKQTEQAVQTSRRMLQLVLDNIPQGVFWKDLDSRYLGCNAVVLRYRGVEDERSILGKSDRDFGSLTTAQAEAFIGTDREVMASGEARLGIIEETTFSDGSTRWLETNKMPLRNTAGAIMGVLGTWQDVTERKEAGEILQMMRFSVDRAGDSIFWLSREGRITYANDAACATLGYSREELLRKRIFDLDPNYQPGVWGPHFEELKRRGSLTLETLHRTKAGRVYPIEVHANYVDFGGQEFNFCFARDITVRKANEEEIRRLAAFPQMNPNPVLELTAEGAIHFHNAAALVLANELGFATPLQMLPPGTAAIVRECLATDKSRVRLEIAYGKSTVSWAFYPIPERGIVHCYASDVTEPRQLAEQLRQAQKMESVGQLAAGIAHDFNNLLTVILGYNDLVGMGVSGNPHLLDAVNQIAVAGERAAGLTRQLLLFSRKSVAQRCLIDLNELSANLSKMLGRILGEDIALRLECQPGLPSVFADPGMLEQVITNLCVNARDAMPKGGRLEMATSVVELGAARVAINPEARPGRFVGLSVSDTGSGIAPHHLSKIFEPFFTTKDVGKGTGLGLATAYGVLMQHQGVIEVSSEPGAGTRFDLFLPALASAAGQSAAGLGAASSQAGGHETVLLVEDEPAMRALLETLLTQAGYTVLCASSGAVAQQMWPRHRHEIDLLLTDMVMPGGVSGKELAENLLGENPALRVIFMSGYNPEIRAGATGIVEGLNYLQKPFKHTALLGAVRRQLDLR